MCSILVVVSFLLSTRQKTPIVQRKKKKQQQKKSRVNSYAWLVSSQDKSRTIQSCESREKEKRGLPLRNREGLPFI
jgi:hypothetical protein